MAWTAADIPRLNGTTVIVTGGNGGLGEVTARELARQGASVVIAARNLEKAAGAEARIRAEVGEVALEVMPLDLADLASVRAFGESWGDRSLDVLVNNAGVMAIPYRQTADGFEMQIGTNHLGHFALTGLLLPALLEGTGGRIVNVASTAHRMPGMSFDDLRSDKGYEAWGAYARSKIANLYFTYELQRRVERKGVALTAVAAHPGYAATDLQHVAPRLTGSVLSRWLMNAGNALMAQSADRGALPQMYAATHSDVVGGDYYGPDGFMEMWGNPRKVESSKKSHDVALQHSLWEQSIELTGVSWAALD